MIIKIILLAINSFILGFFVGRHTKKDIDDKFNRF